MTVSSMSPSTSIDVPRRTLMLHCMHSAYITTSGTRLYHHLISQNGRNEPRTMPPQQDGTSAASVTNAYGNCDPLAPPVATPCSDDEVQMIANADYNVGSGIDDIHPLLPPAGQVDGYQYKSSMTMSSASRLPIRSVQKRKSFIMEFVEKKAPRQILILVLLLALGFGSIIAVVPAVMTDRYARLNHGFSDPKDCAEFSIQDKPHACLAGSGDAQNAAAFENLVSNMFTFISSSLVGSISDEKGRRGTLCRCAYSIPCPFRLQPPPVDKSWTLDAHLVCVASYLNCHDQVSSCWA